MNFLDIKAGEPLEVGTLTGFRFWRYDISSDSKPRLYSFIADRRWYPGEPFEARAPDGGPVNVDVGAQGVHAFKDFEGLMAAIKRNPQRLVGRAKLSGMDGIVIGTVALWGVLWEHTRGYRAEYARPLSFMMSYGYWHTEALRRLRMLYVPRDTLKGYERS